MPTPNPTDPMVLYLNVAETSTLAQLNASLKYADDAMVCCLDLDIH